MKFLFTIVLIFFASNVHADELSVLYEAGVKKAPKVQKLQAILDEVKKITGLYVSLDGITIDIPPTHGDLFIIWHRLYGGYGGFLSWYDQKTNTIYTYANVAHSMLGHEFTHALVDKFSGKRWPAESTEILPTWVENKMRYQDNLWAWE